MSIIKTIKQTPIKGGFRQIFGGIRRRIGDTEISRLRNGIRIATERRYGPTSTIGIWIKTGSRYETEETNGIAHFLEHLFFKGTGKRTREKLEQEVEQIGAHFNAYTGREQGSFYMNIFGDKIKHGVEFLSDIILNSTFSHRSIKAERDTIIRECQEVDTDLNEILFENLHSLTFKGNSLSFPILGPTDNILKFSRHQFLNYYSSQFIPENIVLVAVGDVEHSQFVDLAQKYFNFKTQNLNSNTIQKLNKPTFQGGIQGLINPIMPVSHYALAIEGASWNNPDFYAFSLLNQILGNFDHLNDSVYNYKNNQNSFKQIVLKEKLASKFTGFHYSYSDTGLFGCSAIGDPDKIKQFIHHLQNEFHRISTKLTNEELELAKIQFKSLSLLQKSTTFNFAEEIGRELLMLDKRVSDDEFSQMVDNVDLKSIQKIALRFLSSSVPKALSFLAPHEPKF
eukprot:Anaeramoba_ignava/a219928_45.p1 GENE.a219928_45~~a219928_45.p1  ORF type:complete len:453 (-),score=136.22 a219928_45:155-1513(-)